MVKQTALITGASAGIGEALAERFAKDGHDVVLVARGRARLEALAQRLRDAHKIEAHAFACDLSKPSTPSDLFARMQAEGLAIDFLVNNAGFGSNGAFLDLDLDSEAEMVEVNATALLKLTRLFGRPMRDRGFGRILNIASTAGFQPGPYMATYYATKAFVVSFSEAIAYELKGSGVTVTCHCPGATATEFAARAGNEKTRLFEKGNVASVDDVAADAYTAMMRGEVLAVHGPLNRVGVTLVRFSPRGVVRSVAGYLNHRVSPST